MFNNSVNNLKRPIIWALRIRNRCGYGVHSPFAFNLITHIIYEKTPYYSYKTLNDEIKEKKNNYLKGWNDNSKKVNRLLFRLVNHLQPNTIVSFGSSLSSSSLYLQAGNKKANFYFRNDFNALPSIIDFLYIYEVLTESQINKLISAIPSHGICIVKGIYSSREMKEMWKYLKNNEHVGITFDLYDIGILFFDKSKIKQHYKVNF